MKEVLTIGRVQWIHFSYPNKQELIQVGKEFDLHEIILEDILEGSIQDKIDVYDNHIFMVLHFPKYNTFYKNYISNEFCFILWRNFLITITSQQSNNIERIKKEYLDETQDTEDPERYKISPYYIVYKILDRMFDKVIQLLIKSARDITLIEEEIFSQKWLSTKFLENLMIKRRNLIFLKHLFLPQSEVIGELQKTIEKFYDGELDLYFEDILYKLDKIENIITTQLENITSLSDVYHSLMNIKLNSILRTLTVFTLIIGNLTFIVWIYGMNIPLPFQEEEWFFYAIHTFMAFGSLMLLYIFKKKGWFD